MQADVIEFINLATTVVPPWEIDMAEFNGPLPGACDERFHNVCAALRALPPQPRCHALELLPATSREWLGSGAHRMAMLSVRQQSRSHLEDALLGIFINFPDPNADQQVKHDYPGALAICWRCAQLLGLTTSIFIEQLQYVCDMQVHTYVEAFLQWKPEDKRLQRWSFREEIGDHGIIFRWGRLPVPEAWL